VVVPVKAALEQIGANSALTLHVPEFAAESIAENDVLWRQLGHRSVDVNILNLNHHVLPGRRVFNRLRARCPRVTMTADIWATSAYEQVFGVDVHWLPVWIWPEDIARVPFGEKRDVMLVSPDAEGQLFRERVLRELRSRLPGTELVVVRRMSFKDYCELEAIAKWAITFGEGHDGYFMGPAMRGGIPFAVFNDTFVGWNRADWRTLYADYDEMASHIGDDLAALSSEQEYERYSTALHSRYRTRGVLAVLRRQVVRFCAGTFDYYPGPAWRPADFVD
jgi:hypothetical protein